MQAPGRVCFGRFFAKAKFGLRGLCGAPFILGLFNFIALLGYFEDFLTLRVLSLILERAFCGGLQNSTSKVSKVRHFYSHMKVNHGFSFSRRVGHEINCAQVLGALRLLNDNLRGTGLINLSYSSICVR